MRKVIAAVVLQALAVTLALLHLQSGVVTDEAKYLLNIPYPHPPLVRTVLHWMTALPAHEAVIRILFATLLIQSVWFIRHQVLATRRVRVGICFLWLGSAAVLLQAGTIMMSPLSAMFALVFVLVLVRPDPTFKNPQLTAFWLAVLWFASLFTAYQAVLFVPLFIAGLHRLGISRRLIALYVLAPLVPLAAYSLANPLSLGSMLLVAHGDPDGNPIGRLVRATWLWWVGGSGILSVLGTWGAVYAKRWDILATLGLILLYAAVSYQDYYAILFTPVLLAGAVVWMRDQPPVWNRLIWAPSIACTVFWLFGISTIFSPQSFWRTTNPARDTMRALAQQPASGLAKILIVGPFGHEWQYYAPGEVLRYTPSLSETGATIVVCTTECPVVLTDGKKHVVGKTVDVFVK